MSKGSKTNLGLVESSKKYLGLPYWYGTFGQVATETLLQQKSKQYSSHYTSSRIAKYRSQIGKQVFDCIGLVKAYLWDIDGKIIYNPNQDKNANGMLAICKEKGAISTIPEMPGILVFMDAHVGVYIGNGEVIEARGFAYGVVKTKLAGRGWKSWGKCPYIQYVNKEDKFEELIKVELQNWQKEMGIKSIDSLVKKGIVNNPEDWKKTLGEPTPQYLFWSIIDRISKEEK